MKKCMETRLVRLERALPAPPSPVAELAAYMRIDELLLMREMVARAVECGGQPANEQDAKDMKRLMALASDRRSGGELANIDGATPDDFNAHQLHDQ
jgi:hypothetical protein